MTSGSVDKKLVEASYKCPRSTGLIGGFVFKHSNMKTKAQEWYLVKKNWMQELEDLTDEQFGSLIRSLYSSQCPEGTQKVLYKALKDEFDRVNENREDGLRKRREASKKGNEVKAQSNKVSNPEGSPQGNPVNARTHTHTHTHTQDTLQPQVTLDRVKEFDKIFE